MSDQELFDSLSVLKDVVKMFIRPYGRFNEFVGYLVYTATGTSKPQVDEIYPILYNIEVNEMTQGARIRDESRNTVAYFTGGLCQQKQKMVVYNKDNDVVGSVHEHFAIIETGVCLNRRLYYYEVPTDAVHSGNARFCVVNNLENLGCIGKSEVGSSISIECKRVNVHEKLMLLATGFKIINYQRLFHTHPIPRNILNIDQASIPSLQPVLETLNKSVLRVGFHDFNGDLFVEVLDSTTHNIELVIRYVEDKSGEKSFMDIFGRVQFTSAWTNEKEVVRSVNGQEIGHINRSKPTSIISSSTGCQIMEYGKVYRPSDFYKRKKETHQIFVAGRPDQVLCEFFQHRTQGNLYISFGEAVGVERKTMMMVEVARLARVYFKKLLNFVRPNVHEYPFKSLA